MLYHYHETTGNLYAKLTPSPPFTQIQILSFINLDYFFKFDKSASTLKSGGATIDGGRSDCKPLGQC